MCTRMPHLAPTCYHSLASFLVSTGVNSYLHGARAGPGRNLVPGGSHRPLPKQDAAKQRTRVLPLPGVMCQGSCCDVRCFNAPHNWQLGWGTPLAVVKTSTLPAATWVNFSLPSQNLADANM